MSDGVDSSARNTANQALNTANQALGEARSAQSTADSAENAARLAAGTAENAERRAQQNEKEIQEVKRQMANIEKSIDRMSSQLADRLDKLASQNTKLFMANAAGFTAVAGMTKKVDSSVQSVEGSVAKNTSALARMEYLRLYNEAKAPARRIEMFSDEIEQRFQQAVLNVYLNRELYNEHFHRIHNEADNKFRTIGEHIFKVFEEDFQPMEKSMSTSPIQYTDSAIDLDLRLIEERSKQLDTDLADLFSDSLDPILQRHSQFETNLSSMYAVDHGAAVGSVAVPATMAYRSGGDAGVFVGNKVHKTSDSDFELTLKTNFQEVNGVLHDNQEMLREKSSIRTMTSDEVAQLKDKLTELSGQGLIREELLAGYFSYLDRFGLSVVSGGNGQASLKGKPPLPPVSEETQTRLLQAMMALLQDGDSPMDIPGVEGQWATEDVGCEDATAIIPTDAGPMASVLQLPFPGARLRRALGVTLQEAEAVLRPFYLWDADVLLAPPDEIAAVVSANATTIRVNTELRRLGLYEQAHDDMLGGGVSSEVYARIAQSLELKEDDLSAVPFVAEALSADDLAVQQTVAAALREQGTYELLLSLNSEHPEFDNDYLSAEQWTAALMAAGVKPRDFYNVWWLTWLDEADDATLDALETQFDSAETTDEPDGESSVTEDAGAEDSAVELAPEEDSDDDANLNEDPVDELEDVVRDEAGDDSMDEDENELDIDSNDNEEG
jgi:hypothetical protein